MSCDAEQIPAGDDPRLLRLSPADNVACARQTIVAGEQILMGGRLVTIAQDVTFGHKVAVRRIGAGEKIIKYGAPIGSATRDISPGEYVHTHNIKSDYLPTYTQRGFGAT